MISLKKQQIFDDGIEDLLLRINQGKLDPCWLDGCMDYVRGIYSKQYADESDWGIPQDKELYLEGQLWARNFTDIKRYKLQLDKEKNNV